MSANTYKEALRYIYSLQKFGIKFGLSKTSNILKAFGDPHKKKTYIHIAGTNGKGSVAAFISSILKEAGYKVGLYTSPHLVRFTERFRINEKEISQEDAAELIFRIRKVFAQNEPPTFFEAATAMAIIYFSEQKTDIDVMEVGMGGRLDATNVITPIVSIITNIGLDHQQFLGSRLIDIAYEKAGIIKKGVEVITGVTQPKIVDFFYEVSKKKNAPLFRIGEHIRYRRYNGRINYYGIDQDIKGIESKMEGIFQARNIAVAIGAIEIVRRKGFYVPDDAIYRGIKNTVWPGRMHLISNSKNILLDGAHNPYAIKMLVKSVKSRFNNRKFILVIGIMKDKDIKGMLSSIVPLARHVIYTKPLYSRAAPPELLESCGKRFHKSGEVIPNLRDAIDKAKEIAEKDELILITGSLFTVGEALAYLDPEKYSADEVTE